MSCMRLSILIVDRSLYKVLFTTDYLKEVLQYRSLHFKTTCVFVVCHNSNNFMNYFCVKHHIEEGYLVWFFKNDHSQCLHSFKSKFHELQFFMLYRKNNREYQGLELILSQLEIPVGAVFYNILHKSEEAFSKFRVLLHVLFNHFQGA